MIDTRVIRALHVERLRKADMGAELDESGAIFQTSTLDALLDGAYDGDVTFAELGERGDLGLGTLDGLDGEMIGLDGEFHQARADGSVRRRRPRGPLLRSAHGAPGRGLVERARRLCGQARPHRAGRGRDVSEMRRKR